MKLSLLSLFSISVLLFSCKDGQRENIDLNTPSSQREVIAGSQEFLEMCEEFWKKRYPSDETIKMYLKKILSEGKLTENNEKFISALVSYPSDVLVPQKPIYPIFRLSETQVGIFAFPQYDYDSTSFEDISAENRFIQKHTDIRKDLGILDTAEYFFPELIKELLEKVNSPDLYYYSITGKGESNIDNFGVKYGECLDFYIYSLPQNEKIAGEELLFGSPYEIDLVYENYPHVDSLISAQYKNECLDCPTSFHLEKTFARLEGTKNIYFVYADTFPINDQLDTPSRGIVYLNESNEVGYLWYEEIDLFGCSCL